MYVIVSAVIKNTKMTDSNPVVMASTNGLVDKSKELQKEILMEKLRSKTSQFKNLTETSKGVRMALLVRTFITLPVQDPLTNKHYMWST